MTWLQLSGNVVYLGMETKLELKHLAPYLPYGLGCVSNLYKGDLKYVITGVFLKNSIWFINLNNSTSGFNIKTIRPVLRPMSDIIYEDISIREINDLETEKGFFVKPLSFSSSQYLFKRHFDVFSLIPAGLAIDINTLQSPTQTG